MTEIQLHFKIAVLIFSCNVFFLVKDVCLLVHRFISYDDLLDFLFQDPY